MKKILVAVICCLVLFSCEKDQKDDLEGKWQLKEVVDLSSGITNTVDTVWYNIENTLFMYQLYNSSTDSYSFSHGLKTWEDKQTVLFELVSDPQPVTDFLPLTDWVTAKRAFQVEKVSGSKMVLSSEGKRYLFKKF